MPIEGYMINGKFMDNGGKVYNIVPKDAIIHETLGEPPKNAPPQKEIRQQTPERAKETSAPPPQPTSAPTQQNTTTYPGCISYEILKAVQTPSMAQITVRAHCDNQFADAVVHFDFDAYEDIIKLQFPGGNTTERMKILKFKNEALMTAQRKAAQIAKELLCQGEITESKTEPIAILVKEQPSNTEADKGK